MQNNIVPKEFLGAFSRGHRKDAKEFIDDKFAYVLLAKAQKGCKESLEALQWLTKFNNEYHKSVFYKNGDALHNTKELKADCMNRSNQTRRDVFHGERLLLTFVEQDLQNFFIQLAQNETLNLAHPYWTAKRKREPWQKAKRKRRRNSSRKQLKQK